MIGTISPVVYGSRKRSKWIVAVALYAAGAGASSFMLGAAAGILGSGLGMVVPARARLLVLSALAFAYALYELSLIPLPKPQRRWQVPARWRVHFHPWMASTLYGIVLGFGVLNYISVTTFHITLAWAFLAGDPLRSGLIMSVYGAAQALPILIAGWRVETWDDASTAAVNSLEFRGAIHFVNGAALLIAAAYVSVVLYRL
ncbi:MAG TPA: sulfite exporter TauE/SafE family protein [Pyrinomonadaceae bacterium]|jgi:cytochrome c biogenesis protein CcdA